MHLLLLASYPAGIVALWITAANLGLSKLARQIAVTALGLVMLAGDMWIVHSQTIPEEQRANLHCIRVDFTVKKFRRTNDGSVIGFLSGSFVLRNSGSTTIKPGSIISIGIFVVPFPGLSEAGEEQLFEGTHVNDKCNELGQSREIFPGDELAFNCNAKTVLDADRLTGLTTGDYFVYTPTRVYFRDKYGFRQTDSCLFYEGPRHRDCFSHNVTTEYTRPKPPKGLARLFSKIWPF